MSNRQHIVANLLYFVSETRHDLKKTTRGSELAHAALLSSSPHGFREICFYYESMGANDLEYGLFGPNGHDLHRGPLNMATY